MIVTCHANKPIDADPRPPELGGISYRCHPCHLDAALSSTTLAEVTELVETRMNGEITLKTLCLLISQHRRQLHNATRGST